MQHSNGYVVDLVGLQESNQGRSCEYHSCCGSVVDCDTLVRLRRVQIVNANGIEETAIAAHWVTDAVDRCRVGFLPRYCVPHYRDFDGKLAQVIEMLDVSEFAADRRRSFRNKGACRIALLQGMQRHALPQYDDDHDTATDGIAIATNINTTVPNIKPTTPTTAAAPSCATTTDNRSKTTTAAEKHIDYWLQRRIRESSDTPLSKKQMARRVAKTIGKKKPPVRSEQQSNASTTAIGKRQKQPPFSTEQQNNGIAKGKNRRVTRSSVVCYKDDTDDEEYLMDTDDSNTVVTKPVEQYKDDKAYESDPDTEDIDASAVIDPSQNLLMSPQPVATEDIDASAVIDPSQNLLLSPQPMAKKNRLFKDFVLSPLTQDTLQLGSIPENVAVTQRNSHNSNKKTKLDISKYSRATRSASSKEKHLLRSNKKY
jgi:hypothetical protein